MGPSSMNEEDSAMANERERPNEPYREGDLEFQSGRPEPPRPHPPEPEGGDEIFYPEDQGKPHPKP